MNRYGKTVKGKVIHERDRVNGKNISWFGNFERDLLA